MNRLRWLPPVLAVLLVLGIAELGLRHGYYRLAVVVDPALGELVNAPGVARWGREGHGTSHWLEHGLRGTRPPQPELPRVLVVGDSFTEALQVDDAETFTHVAEARLSDQGRNVQVLNAGFSGRSAADHVALAPTYRPLIAPVWTVVAMTDSDLTTDAWDVTKTHFERAGQELRVVRVPPRPRQGAERLLGELRRRSSLLDYSMVRLGELREVSEREAPLFRAADVAPAAGASPLEDRSFPVEDAVDALIAAHQGRLSILWLSSFDPAAPARSTPVETRVAAQAAARGIGFVATRARFDTLERRAPFGFADSGYNQGHLNLHGHRIAGELLAEEIVRRGVDGVR